MSEEDATPQVYAIVVGIDYSESSALALREAVRLAKSHAQSHLHVVHVTPVAPQIAQTLGLADPSLGGNVMSSSPSELLVKEIAENLRTYVEQALAAVANEVAVAPIRWSIHVRQADPAHALAQLASDLRADLVVVGTHGRKGLARFLMGSVAEGVVRLAPCPVLVMRPIGAQSEAAAQAIEPPCPECVEARRASGGQELWCDRHREHHNRAHTFHFTPFRDSHSSGMLIRP
ncbi:MAG: universal stress protein [Polyangiaceae bacterium]